MGKRAGLSAQICQVDRRSQEGTWAEQWDGNTINCLSKELLRWKMLSTVSLCIVAAFTYLENHLVRLGNYGMAKVYRQTLMRYTFLDPAAHWAC